MQRKKFTTLFIPFSKEEHIHFLPWSDTFLPNKHTISHRVGMLKRASKILFYVSKISFPQTLAISLPSPKFKWKRFWKEIVLEKKNFLRLFFNENSVNEEGF